MIKRLFVNLMLWQILLGCSFVAGLLRMDAVEIVAWSPNRERVVAEQVTSVTITFSSSMNRVLAEEAFSLSRGDNPLHGRFSWQEGGTILVFVPEVPFTNGCRFTLEVTESAEDLYGNSLSEPFDFCFATAEELLPPEVVHHEPADGAQVSSARTPIRIVFSEPIDPSSFYPGFSLFPSVHGGFSWTAGGEEVEFAPLVDYRPGETYEVVLGREISDQSGNRLAEEIRFEFYVQDMLQPSIESVTTLGDGELLIPLQLGGGIDPSLEIEKDERFLFTFSQGPTEEQKHDLFTVEPFTPFAVIWDEENRFCELGFEENLCWNQVYSIELLGLTYSFVVNGQQSLPITVAALTYCPDLNAPSGDDKFVLLRFADNVDFGGAVAPAFDFHLEHAPGSQVDLGSFLQAFELTIVPACISVTLEDVELSPLAIDPYLPPGSGRSVVRLHCSVLEDPAVTGTITFRLSTELRDTAENHLAEDYVLLVDNN
jgi:hypothetical protein